MKAAFVPSRFVRLPTKSCIDIQFYCNFNKIYTDIPLEFPTDHQLLLLQGFKDVLSPTRDDGKRFSSTSENLKNVSPDQKSRFPCDSPFKRWINFINSNFSPFLGIISSPYSKHKVEMSFFGKYFWRKE